MILHAVSRSSIPVHITRHLINQATTVKCPSAINLLPLCLNLSSVLFTLSLKDGFHYHWHIFVEDIQRTPVANMFLFYASWLIEVFAGRKMYEKQNTNKPEIDGWASSASSFSKQRWQQFILLPCGSIGFSTNLQSLAFSVLSEISASFMNSIEFSGVLNIVSNLTEANVTELSLELLKTQQTVRLAEWTMTLSLEIICRMALAHPAQNDFLHSRSVMHNVCWRKIPSRDSSRLLAR